MKFTRYFALLIGVSFVLAGVGGFLPFVTPPMPSDAPPLMVDGAYGHLIGLFPVNVIHNLVHLAIGVSGLWAWRKYEISRQFCKVLAILLGIFTVMGLLPALSTTFGLMPLFGHDIWLHGLEAVVGFYLGFIARPETISQPITA